MLCDDPDGRDGRRKETPEGAGECAPRAHPLPVRQKLAQQLPWWLRGNEPADGQTQLVPILRPGPRDEPSTVVRSEIGVEDRLYINELKSFILFKETLDIMELIVKHILEGEETEGKVVEDSEMTEGDMLETACEMLVARRLSFTGLFGENISIPSITNDDTRSDLLFTAL
ncbi:hypothetical protein MJG53_007892 [Ovis ammon polii x Ovis aries]|uniref:Uncharacterized protein n=1 Tax=Ovis ammon polii x Ovis aries TaxID=2918886 RepID=A0ACB9V468_9CETA|nr:hypothetical protein MJG53_007892 [Ovis ammon polii x Ovis aries]